MSEDLQVYTRSQRIAAAEWTFHAHNLLVLAFWAADRSSDIAIVVE
jgi:hypothetical protein